MFFSTQGQSQLDNEPVPAWWSCQLVHVLLGSPGSGWPSVSGHDLVTIKSVHIRCCLELTFGDDSTTLGDLDTNEWCFRVRLANPIGLATSPNRI